MLNLEDWRTSLEEERKKIPKSRDAELQHVSAWLNYLCIKLDEDLRSGLTAQKAVEKSIWAFEYIDEKEFLIANILEGLKRGQSLQKSLEQLQQIGLAPTDVSGFQPLEPPDEELPSGPFLRKALVWLRRIGHWASRFLVEAVRRIPQFAKLKVSVGLTGAVIPTILFDVGEGLKTALELLEMVQAPRYLW